MSQSVSHSVMSNSLWPMDSKPTRLLSPRNSQDKNTGVGCHSLLQGIFPTRGSNLSLPRCGQSLSHLSHHVCLFTEGIRQFWIHLLPPNLCFPWLSSTAPMSGGCFAVLTGGFCPRHLLFSLAIPPIWWTKCLLSQLREGCTPLKEESFPGFEKQKKELLCGGNTEVWSELTWPLDKLRVPRPRRGWLGYSGARAFHTRPGAVPTLPDQAFWGGLGNEMRRTPW